MEEIFKPDKWLPWLPSILTIVGWGIVNSQTNKREMRKEHRALVDSIKKQLHEINLAVVEHYQDAESKRARKIIADLQALEIELERIPGFSRGSFILIHLAKYTDAATGGSFESADREAVSVDSKTIQDIILARNILLEDLEKWFSDKYL